MNKKSFTLIEILVTLIVLSILASVSVAFYQKTVDANNERICAENLKVLQAAIDIYTVENDALPAALSQLTPRLIYLAYSRVIGERKENPLSIAFRKMLSTEPAIASQGQPTANLAEEGEKFKRKYLSGNIKVFRDPADKNYQGDPGPGCTGTCGSYTFNFAANQTTDSTGKKLNKNSNFALVYDLENRHKGKFDGLNHYKIGITPGGRVGKAESGYILPN